ncbi:hypothetical protein SAMN04488058_101506 [Deinococcus reticulitermitis]|uniref:Uncharacterized protein n=1 Tax=Deinococcus reticulitermitis TaxID=856736 RepID=A0A1H6TEX6_9DEIO|nr:hypothetical protein [Deinococcus reticulitermitis]SEI74850.1 hypothetical protein SAMN04488058_101506 [Deinococcus reticulitermitis]
MRGLVLAVLILLSLTPARATAPEAPQPVLVEFGGLLWVQAAGGVPELRGGQIVAPVLPMCRLFGAQCRPDWAKGTVLVEQAGKSTRVPLTGIRQRGSQGVGLVGLRAMSGPLGYAGHPELRRAKVERVRKVPGGLSYVQGDAAGLKLEPTELQAPAEVWTQPVEGEPDARFLFVSSPTRTLGRLWPFHRDEHGQPGRSSVADCIGLSSPVCRVTYRENWLYTLAYVTLASIAAEP